MTIFVALVLTALSFVLIAYPLFKRGVSSGAPVGDDKYRELHSKQDTTYSMLKELEFDFQSGILTEEDYRDLEVRYKRKAISILKDADSLEKGNEAEGDIEAQVQKLRRVKNNSLDREVEQEVLKLRRSSAEGRHGHGKFCSQCGAASQESDRFCASCGTELR